MKICMNIMLRNMTLLTPYKEVPWIGPHNITLYLIRNPLQHTSPYSLQSVNQSANTNSDGTDHEMTCTNKCTEPVDTGQR